MATFEYVATKDGKTTKGTLTAANRDAALAVLNRQQLKPTLLKATKGKKKFRLKDISLDMQIGTPTVKLRDKVVFTRQLSTMVSAGVPLDRSLSTLSQQTESKGLQAILPQITKAVESGSTLADAMAAHPKVFGDFIKDVFVFDLF